MSLQKTASRRQKAAGSGPGSAAYTTLDDVDRFWAFTGDRFERIQGGDAGVGFLSIRGRYTVITNQATGARQVVEALDQV